MAREVMPDNNQCFASIFNKFNIYHHLYFLESLQYNIKDVFDEIFYIDFCVFPLETSLDGLPEIIDVELDVEHCAVGQGELHNVLGW